MEKLIFVLNFNKICQNFNLTNKYNTEKTSTRVIIINHYNYHINQT